jgi:cell volume regulation protein A
MAIFLTLTFATLLTAGTTDVTGSFIAMQFFQQIGIGIALGFTGGKALIWVFDRVAIDSGLYPIFALASGLLVFGATNLLGGSGFLAVYIAGLLLGNHQYKAKQVVQQFMDGMAWLAQLVMLLVLGLLVTPSELIQDIPIAIVIAFMLIFVARPMAVFTSLLFERFSWREKIFISWVGLRGGIPIYLAIIPAMYGLEGEYFNIAFVVVLCSLFLQGWTIRPVARILDVKQKAEA